MWTEAKYINFIKNGLRSLTMKWAPIQKCRKDAQVSRGVYLCNGCEKNVKTTIVVDGVRSKNIFVDHIEPIVDPNVGFTGFDDFIERMFCESDNLQVLCKECHDDKSYEERKIATDRRKREKV